MPIYDYHNHLSAQEIYEDKHYDNITQIWLGGDHYKWRAMRANGIDESLITGHGADRDKFNAWAQTGTLCVWKPALSLDTLGASALF